MLKINVTNGAADNLEDIAEALKSIAEEMERSDYELEDGRFVVEIDGICFEIAE